MQINRTILVFTFLTLFSILTHAGAVDGNWIFHKNNSDNLDRALNIQGSSFTSLITTADGAALESGWWTENPGFDGKISVIVRYGDSPPDNIAYKLESPDKALIWFDQEPSPWGTMTRMNCNLIMAYRNKSDVAPEGCAWLHIRGWGYSGLDGECIYNSDWADLDEDENAPMECLIEAPAEFIQ